MKSNLIRHWVVPLSGGLVVVGCCAALMFGVVRGYHSPHRIEQPESLSRQTQPAKTSAQAGVQLGGAVASTPKTYLYECLANGVRVYSQQRCGANAKLRGIDTGQMNTFQSKVYAVSDSTESVAVNGPGQITNASDDTMSRGLDSSGGGLCAEIELSISQVETRLRHGYSVPEGDHLRARLHELLDESHEQKCG